MTDPGKFEPRAVKEPEAPTEAAPMPKQSQPGPLLRDNAGDRGIPVCAPMLSTRTFTMRWLTMMGRRYLSSAPALADVVAKWHNPAAMLHGAKDLRFGELPMADEVAPGDVRVQMKAVGICGSDVHFLKNVRKLSRPRPVVP